MPRLRTQIIQLNLNPLESDPLFSGKSIEFSEVEEAEEIRPIRRLILCLDGS